MSQKNTVFSGRQNDLKRKNKATEGNRYLKMVFYGRGSFASMDGDSTGTGFQDLLCHFRLLSVTACGLLITCKWGVHARSPYFINACRDESSKMRRATYVS